MHFKPVHIDIAETLHGVGYFTESLNAKIWNILFAISGEDHSRLNDGQQEIQLKHKCKQGIRLYRRGNVRFFVFYCSWTCVKFEAFSLFVQNQFPVSIVFILAIYCSTAIIAYIGNVLQDITTNPLIIQIAWSYLIAIWDHRGEAWFEKSKSQINHMRTE